MAAASGPVYNAGCLWCGQPGVVLPGNAVFTGTHVAWFNYAGQCVCIEFEAVQGEPMVVPVGNLGAPYTYTFHVEQPDEEGLFVLTVDGKEYERFRLCIKVPLVGQVVMMDAEAITCENLNDPENGLSASQRVECILPTYTLAEFMAGLTDGQKAALIGWLCTACPSMCAQIEAASNEAVLDCLDTPGRIDAIKAILCDVCPTLCESIGAATNAEVVACISSTPGRLDALKALICDVCASLCSLLGAVEDATTEVLPCLGGDQLLQLQVAVRRTDGGAILYFVPAAGTLDLDPVLVTVTQAEGTTLETEHDVLGLNANRIAIGLTIPRFEVFLSDGVTPYATADINAPTITLPLQDVRNSAATLVSQHEVGVDGVAPDATMNLNNTGGTPLIVGVNIPAGTLGTAIAPDATAVLKDSAGATLLTEAIPSGATENIIAPDGTVKTTDAGTTVMAVKSNAAANLPQSRIKYTDAAGAAQVTAAADTEFTAATLRSATLIPRRPMKNSGGTTVGASQIDVAQLIADTVPIAPDARAVVRNSVPTTLSTTDIAAGVTTNLAVADSVITHPDATTSNLPATVALDVRTYRSGIAYNFGRMLHSGQTTAHRTGDEGSIYGAGFFTYVPPVYPLSYAELAADFLTLAANNMHGNTLRFTDRAGAAAATSGARTIQDHLTGVEWRIPNSMPAAVIWNTAIDAAEAATDDSSTDWHLPSDRMLDSITDDSLNTVLNFAPFSVSADLWTGTTVPNASPINARRLVNVGGSIAGLAKASTCSYIYCRRFI